jgi:ubiquitin-conjugating enzyme E2 W
MHIALTYSLPPSMYISNTLALQLQDHVPPGITIVKCDNLEEWQMDIKVLDQNPLYLDQTYRLKFTFSKKYPIGKPNPPPPTFLAPSKSLSTSPKIPRI